MKTKMIKLLGLALLSVQLVACGNSTASNDNIEILNSTTLPAINSFVTGSINTNLAQGFSSAAPYWTFNNFASTFGNYLAPARAIVGEIGVSQVPGYTSTFVTLIHSGRVATRIYGMQSINVRSGDVVYVGQAIGAFFTTGSLVFQVLVDGAAVCPLSYMSPTFRATFTTFGLPACQ
jgi:hypothetical protein